MQKPTAENLRYIYLKKNPVYELLHRYDPPIGKSYGPNIGFVSTEDARTLRMHTDSDDEFKVAMYEFIIYRDAQVDFSVEELSFKVNRENELFEIQARPEGGIGKSPTSGEWRAGFTACIGIKDAARIAQASDGLDAFKLALHEFAKQHFKRRLESRGIDVE
jgi:hypothetical protein